MVIAWWLADVSLAAGLLLAFLVVTAELAVLVSSRRAAGAVATVEGVSIERPAQEQETARTPAAVAGKSASDSE